MSIDEHEEEHEHPLYPGGLPTWRFSFLDMIGLSITTVAGLFGTVAQGLNMISREFNAAANFERRRKDEAELREAYEASQRAAAADLERHLGLTGPVDES